jgi:ubiquinone/menaquinone biosynthesis C-methylase UbiE
LRLFAKELHLVDINQSCLDACLERFGESSEGTGCLYHLTSGNDLHSIASNSATLVYSWDSMVHFDVKEIARILAPGGTAFLHHSNYGAMRPDSDWAKNDGTRSDMSADLMNEYAGDNGLKVVKQEIHGKEQGWGVDNFDCVSLLYKPG